MSTANKDDIITLVHCSSETEGVLYARTFNHKTQWDEMQAAFSMVMDMASKKKGRYYSMGDASMKMVTYTPAYADQISEED